MIIITDEIQKNEELSIVEKVVLSIYKNYTEKGKYKCCTLTNAQIADELKISKYYIKKIRNHLEDLGYISTKGIKVVYLGKTDTIVSLKTDTIVSGVDTIVSLKGTPEYPLKKENKEIKKEEIKEEIKKKDDKIDLVFSLLPKEYLTSEKKEVIIEWLNNNEKFNNTSYTDLIEGNKASWVIGAKEVVDKKFPVEYYVAPKVEPKKEEHNWWDD